MGGLTIIPYLVLIHTGTTWHDIDGGGRGRMLEH